MTKYKDNGFVLIKIDNSTIYSNIFDTILSFIKDNPYSQNIIFNSFSEKIDNSKIPILHLNQAKFFYGNIFVFDFISLILTKKFPNIYKKYFYAQDIPWESVPNTNYQELCSFLLNNDVEIIAKNQYIYDIYNICWKKPIGISENFDYESLKQII